MSAFGRVSRAGARVAGAPGLVIGAVVGLVVLAPVLRPGFVLTYDMVFVPRQPITLTTLGLDGSVPRAVPTDLVVALLSRAVPADVLQKLLLFAVFVLAGWGVARLVGGRAGAAAAALAYTWNAYVAERLVIGHWTMLLGYALLPWAVTAALTARTTGRLHALYPWLFAAALCGATAGIEVAVVALVVLAWPMRPTGLGPAGRAAAFAVAANAPWWLPTVLHPGGVPADVRGLSAFAAHSDTPFGLVGSLLTLGGIWNHAVVPPERASTALVGTALVVVAVAVVLGARVVAAWWGGAGTALLVLAGGALLVAAAASIPGVSVLLRLVVEHVPGGGLLRDGQKFLAPTALCIALCIGATVKRLVGLRRAGPAVLALALAAVPAVVLPGLAWGSAGRLGVSHYPHDWYAVRRLIAGSDRPGDVAVFPWYLYRRFAWNGDRVVLDPAQRFFSRRTLVNDDLPLTELTVRGEDPRARRVSDAIARGDSVVDVLKQIGVRFVVVERRSGDARAATPPLQPARTIYLGADLALYELSGTRPAKPDLPWIASLGLVAAAGAGLMAGVGRFRGRDSNQALTLSADCASAEERRT